MTENRYVTNPDSGREISIGGPTFCRLVFNTHDFINGELIRRETAPLLESRHYLYNIQTNRRIIEGSRRYHELITAGWTIEYNYYLTPPGEIVDIEALDRVILGIASISYNQRRNSQPINPTYENIMAVHRERLISLNISLCRECLCAIKLEEGEYCNDCIPH